MKTVKTGTFFPPERKIVKKLDFAEDESSQIENIEVKEAVETANEVKEPLEAKSKSWRSKNRWRLKAAPSRSKKLLKTT